MIIVTGTKRSGTSMWMQILASAGFTVIGEKFPHDWISTIKGANPRGFYESKLCRGVNFQTNPNPETGTYLAPVQVQSHAVKIFAPGVTRTDVAFIDRVIVTIRPWREFAASIAKLRQLSRDVQGLDESRRGIIPMPAALEWWVDNFALVRDVAIRRYPINFVSYRSVIDDPGTVIGATLGWLGDGDQDAAVAAVERSLHRNKLEELDVNEDDIPRECVEIFDRFYDQIHARMPLDSKLIEDLNRCNGTLIPLILECEQRASDALKEMQSKFPVHPNSREA
jgi:hypothetical protein